MKEIAKRIRVRHKASCRACGHHLLLTLRNCNREILNDELMIRALASRAARESGATVLKVVSHKFQPCGITAIVLLAESHASFHSYPEIGMAFWDCFTCGHNCCPQATTQILIEALQAGCYEEQLLERVI
jgi:S-adenosylmethionine decarboxylase